MGSTRGRSIGTPGLGGTGAWVSWAGGRGLGVGGTTGPALYLQIRKITSFIVYYIKFVCPRIWVNKICILRT
jgi:hypothetical protein